MKPAQPRHTDPEIRRLLGWMQTVITHKGGVEAGLADERAQADFELDRDSLEQLILPARGLSSLQRVEIYADMYLGRLVDVMAEDFSALRHVIGERGFHELVREYVDAHPSTFFSLNRLGHALPEFVRAHPRPRREFLGELAELELALTQVFDGPSTPALTLAEIETVAPAAWAGLRLPLVPNHRLLEFRFPTNAYLQDLREGRKPKLPKPKPSWTLVYRKDFTVWRATLTREQHALLRELVGGARLGEALETLAADERLDAAALAQGLPRWFREWAAEGLFAPLSA